MPGLTTFTVKPGGGGNYTSLNAALLGEATNLTTLDEIYRFDLYPGEDTTKVLSGPTSSSWVTDATRYVELRVVDSGGNPVYTYTWSTSIYRLNVNTLNASVIYLPGSAGTGIHHLKHTAGTLQVRATGDSEDFSGIFELHNDGFAHFDGGGIIVDELFDTVEQWRAIKVDGAADYRFRNFIAYSKNAIAHASAAVNQPFGGGVLTLQNCTFDGYQWGILSQNAGNTIVNTNCRYTNIGTLLPTWANLGSITGSNNLTDETTNIPPSWTATQSGATLDYVDATNATMTSRDYRLNSSTDDGYQNGKSLASSFTIDVGGSDRSVPWDIGAHELSTSADDHSLSIQDCLHAHTADLATLNPDESGLVIQDSTHAHVADNASVFEPAGDHTLSIRSSLHLHSAHQCLLTGAGVAAIRVVDGGHV